MFSEDEILRHVLETIQAGYWDCNFQDHTEYLSPRFKGMLGYQNHELTSYTASWSEIVHPDDVSIVKDTYRQHIISRGAISFRVEVRFLHKSGSVVWIQSQGKVVEWDQNGSPVRFIGSHIDITSQKQVETELRHYQAALTSLKRIGTNSHLTYDEQIDAALKVVSEYLDLPLGIMSHVRDETFEVMNVVAKGLPFSIEKGQIFELDRTYCNITFRENHVVGIHQVSQSDHAMHPCYLDTKLETYIAAPIQLQEGKYGTVSFSSPFPRTHPFSQRDLEFIEILANWIGYRVEKREVTRALEFSQKKTRAIFENSRDAIMLVDHSSLKITDCNQMAVDLFELDGKEELLGRRGIDFHKHLFTEVQYQEYNSLTHTGDFFSTDVEYVTKKGKKFWGNLSVFVFELEKSLFQWVRVVDVSEARSRERELQVVKDILSQQTRELQEANEESRSINDSLEFLVRDRTAALEERNRQLADFAFLNAHKMRGPLARILGLVDVLKLTDSREEEREYLQYIIQSAKELDQAIRSAANTLVTPEYAQGDGTVKGAL